MAHHSGLIILSIYEEMPQHAKPRPFTVCLGIAGR